MNWNLLYIFFFGFLLALLICVLSIGIQIAIGVAGFWSIVLVIFLIYLLLATTIVQIHDFHFPKEVTNEE